MVAHICFSWPYTTHTVHDVGTYVYSRREKKKHAHNNSNNNNTYYKTSHGRIVRVISMRSAVVGRRGTTAAVVKLVGCASFVRGRVHDVQPCCFAAIASVACRRVLRVCVRPRLSAVASLPSRVRARAFVVFSRKVRRLHALLVPTPESVRRAMP